MKLKIGTRVKLKAAALLVKTLHGVEGTVEREIVHPGPAYSYVIRFDRPVDIGGSLHMESIQINSLDLEVI
jgi:hypothetical protein